ncbi:hypothetical protein BT93_L2196 [Corymbia citriodora subsp. variegata]|uniref:Transmembrane protein n=1 Tax=Corymbia citriodora subsp. variegata TaxID=360336 RepID=A0A8T0CPT6_CORYI|nr:hypothetical protein BT93_L2196 [Corymbia citriodora subsp. variegata]
MKITSHPFLITSFLLLVLLISILHGIEGRPFEGKKSERSSDSKNGGLFEGVLLLEIDRSGPSPGQGHKKPNSVTLEGIRDSGPSPGVGHKGITSMSRP